MLIDFFACLGEDCMLCSGVSVSYRPRIAAMLYVSRYLLAVAACSVPIGYIYAANGVWFCSLVRWFLLDHLCKHTTL